MYVIDQGSDKVTHRPGFDEAAKKLGDLLEVVEQGNIGGSGGFARAMDETVRAGRADYVLLMDDDVRLDPEGILRAATFADLARRPTIVGGHMFSMYDRSLLHAFAEAIEPHKWWWGPSPNTKARHDFGRRNLRNTPWLHRRAESDYNGWWMCLIPTTVIREIGLSMPVFIKWDDAEYGVRARDRGFPTVSLPGVAAWQVPWDDKDDARNWQAYYHLRNRLVSALLHSPAPKGGAVISESLERQLQSLLSMQYSTVALRLLAVEDVLTGPGHMHREIATKLAAAARGACAVYRREGRCRPGKLPAAAAQGPGRAEALHHAHQQAQPDDQGRGRHHAAVQADARAGQETPADGAALPGCGLVGAGQPGQRPGVGGRRYVRGVVSARSEAVPVAGLAQPGGAPAAAPELGPAGQGVPRRRARLQLTREVARDLRGVGQRLT